ncbi:MAG: hypothetical protein JWR61_3294 [Ferruginibacter sp.]|nr:hypothetical protein [Ferruginibacter sp.]
MGIHKTLVRGIGEKAWRPTIKEMGFFLSQNKKRATVLLK